MKPPLFSCLESRIANNGSLYGRFLFGPLPIDLSLTVATVLRRSLLHSPATFTIVSAEIEGVTHEYASLPGINESVLEILLNLGEIVLTSPQENFLNSNFRTSTQTPAFFFAFIKSSGPCIIQAKDINWPKGIYCVKPNAYIATLSSNETFAMRIKISPSVFCKNSNNHNIKKIKPTLSTSENSESPHQSTPFNKRQFDFFKFQRATKHSLATSLSNLPNANIAIANTFKLSRSIQIQDYTPMSFYSARKRNAQSKTHSLFKTNLNSFNPSYSLAETNNEITALEKKNTQNSPFPKIQREEKTKVDVTFQKFPNLTQAFSTNLLTNNIEPSLNKPPRGAKLRLASPEESLVPSTFSLSTEKQSPEKNKFFGKNITNTNSFLPLKESVPLVISSSSYPVEKVNFLIERDDDLAGYRHRIIFEVWTNGSISPRQAIADSIASIIKLLYSFREPVRHLLTTD